MKRLLLLVVFLPLLGFAQSIEFDKQLGAKNAEQVEQQMELSSDQQKIAYIKKVGQRLVAQLDNPLFEYKFHLVEEPSPNAFALPGGYIYITTGLIPVLNTEDELACIMGHEIIHSNNRHSVKQLKKSIVPKLLEVPGNLIGLIDENLGSFLNLGIETSNSLLLASYGRKFETEADQVGVVNMQVDQRPAHRGRIVKVGDPLRVGDDPLEEAAHHLAILSRLRQLDRRPRYPRELQPLNPGYHHHRRPPWPRAPNQSGHRL